jgi:phage terminase large subunit-like protein
MDEFQLMSPDMLARKVEQGVLRLRADAVRWYNPHARQLEFHRLGHTARERLFLAGNRVGKTLAGAAEMAFHLTGRYPDWWEGVRFAKPVSAWAASVTREATRDILQTTYLGDGARPGVIPPWLVMGAAMKSGVSGGMDFVKVRHISGGASVLGFKSYDQGRRSFQGTVREVIHLDEEPEIEIYEECLMRTLTVQGHIMLTMTPLLGLTDMVRHFVEAAEGGTGRAVVQAGWQDAGHLDSTAVAQMRQSLRPHEQAARERGEPSIGRGRVYPVDEATLRVERFAIPPTWRRCVGVDFGWSNPTAAVWLAHDPASDVVYVTDIYWATEKVPAEHAAAILARGACPAVCDPAGQAVGQKDGVSLVQMYETSGLYFTLADNGVEAGIMAMLERMQAGTLKVFADVEAWWREFRLYARDAKGRIMKRDDHLLDATRYALVSGLPIARSQLPTPPRAALRRGDWRTI